MWRNFIRYCSDNNSYVNTMQGAVTGEEMIQELEDEELQKKKQAELEEKEAKKAEFFEKKRLAQSGSASNATMSQTPNGQSLNKSDSAVTPKVITPFSRSEQSPPQAPNTSQVNTNVEHNIPLSPASHTNASVANHYTTPNGPMYPQVYQPYPYSAPIPQQNQHAQLLQQASQYSQPQYHQVQSPYYQPAQLQGQQYPLSQMTPVMQQPQFSQMQPQLNQMTPQQQPLQQPQMSVQMNGHDEDSWTSVDKAKSATLSKFLGEDLLVVFKDKGLKGYPPFIVEFDFVNQKVLHVTFSLLRMHCQAFKRDQFVIFEFYSMPQNPLLITACNLIPFDGANTTLVGNGNEVLSRLRLNLPDGYDVYIVHQNDRVIVTLFPKGTVTFGRSNSQ